MVRSLILSSLLLTAFHALGQSTCATALPVSAGIHIVPAVDGTELPTILCTTNGQEPAQHAIWYSYLATSDTTIVISTDVSGQPRVNTRMHIYSGTCEALQCEVGNDDGGPEYTSRASFTVQAGQTYFIVFDDLWSADSFSFELTLANYQVVLTETYITFQSTFLSPQGQPLAVVDMDNDNRDDVVAVQNTFVGINRQLPEGGFETVILPTPNATYMPTWSMAAGDLNGNGYKDLLYGNGYGVSIMLRTDDGLGFTQQAGPEYVFSQRTNMVDINNDGNLDAFVCHDVAPNVYYLNDGNGGFSYTQGGLGYSCGNYGSIWIDYDNDGDMDCFVAKCGCDPADLLMRNEGNGTFVNMASAFGPEDYHQSWSSAWGDFDNDGDLDVLIGGSASGYHKFMQNNGDGTFTNVTAGSGMDVSTNQSIEWTTHDFDNDGWLDILSSSSLLMNQGDMTFRPNTYLPGSGSVGDLNGDGFLDVLGQIGYQQNLGNENHWLRINTVGTVSNRGGIGARITLTSALGTQIREVRSGDGFKYMSSLMVHFGLGADTQVQSLSVRWPSGIVQEVEVSGVDQVIDVIEPLTTEIATTTDDTFVLFPNPAMDRLNLSGTMNGGIGNVEVVDLTGRVVLTARANTSTIDISALAAGQYMLRVRNSGGVVEERFSKL
ncbi:MAG: VCBS repeat-containing protein [Flavobacteriales bacterium]|nr:VCBS repeat-containing protein [Flavobacteriales bacterium]MBP6643348.1 VCBS repeat-containing protein [Flavobacteriales bacterium]